MFPLPSLAQHIPKLKHLINSNSTTILTGVGVVGTVSTAYLAGKASFRAAEIIFENQPPVIRIPDENSELKDVSPKPQLTTSEKAQLVWKEYIPAVGVGVLTVTSIIAAHRISSGKIAALAVASGVSERALQEYKDKVLEKVGVKQEEKIRDEIAQDHVSKNPLKGTETIIIGTGDVLCYDMITGRYFHSNVESIRKAENNVNYEVVNFDSCSLSRFYDDIGLPPTLYSDSVGFNLANKLDLDFSTVLTDDGRPCLTISFKRLPITEFDKLWT